MKRAVLKITEKKRKKVIKFTMKMFIVYGKREEN